MSESEVKKAIEILMAAGYSRPQASIVAEAILQWLEARRYMREGVLVQDEKTGLPISNPAARAMASAQKILTAASAEYPAEVEAAFVLLEEATGNGGNQTGTGGMESTESEDTDARRARDPGGTPVPSGRRRADGARPVDGADREPPLGASPKKTRRRLPEFLRR